MTLLFDSHTLVWWRMGDRRLGESVRAEIESSGSQVRVSVATVWELAIKSAAGRLRLPIPVGEWASEGALRGHGFWLVNIRASHVLTAAALPRHHDDPFDRLLIAQAQLEDLTIVTAAAAFNDYDVRVLDAQS